MTETDSPAKMDRNLALEAVRRTDRGLSCESIVMRSKTKTIRRIKGWHDLNTKFSWARHSAL